MSNAPRIYVRGSYIDIHDNENVYLTVDKDGEVKISIAEPQLKQPASAPTVVPEVLLTPEAEKLLEALQCRSAGQGLATHRTIECREGHADRIHSREAGYPCQVEILRTLVGDGFRNVTNLEVARTGTGQDLEIPRKARCPLIPNPYQVPVSNTYQVR